MCTLRLNHTNAENIVIHQPMPLSSFSQLVVTLLRILPVRKTVASDEEVYDTDALADKLEYNLAALFFENAINSPCP